MRLRIRRKAVGTPVRRLRKLHGYVRLRELHACKMRDTQKRLFQLFAIEHTPGYLIEQSGMRGTTAAAPIFFEHARVLDPRFGLPRHRPIAQPF